jgi:hypothetical protein
MVKKEANQATALELEQEPQVKGVFQALKGSGSKDDHFRNVLVNTLKRPPFEVLCLKNPPVPLTTQNESRLYLLLVKTLYSSLE